VAGFVSVTMRVPSADTVPVLYCSQRFGAVPSGASLK